MLALLAMLPQCAGGRAAGVLGRDKVTWGRRSPVVPMGRPPLTEHRSALPTAVGLSLQGQTGDTSVMTVSSGKGPQDGCAAQDHLTP